jgi:hypothetical protein
MSDLGGEREFVGEMQSFFLIWQAEVVTYGGVKTVVYSEVEGSDEAN